MSRYKALIFDLGKVVFDVSFGFAYDKWAAYTGAEQKLISKRFRFDEQYERFERNEIDPAAYAAHVSAMIGFGLTQEEFEAGWNNIYLDVYPGMGRMLAALKANYRLVSLTNTNRVHAEVWPGKYEEVLVHFEKIFSSHEMKCRKPEAESYRTVTAYLGCDPGEIIFLDDRKENIAGAEAAGMKGILVESTSQMKEKLRQEEISF